MWAWNLPQMPDEQVPDPKASVQVVPSSAVVAAEHTPVSGLHVPASWQEPAGQVTLPQRSHEPAEQMPDLPPTEQEVPSSELVVGEHVPV
jgi:hypothetical protein